MSKDFANVRNSSRLQNWNYNWKGLYFVTLNTRIGENYFGEISNDQMHLNEIGKVVEDQWFLTPTVRPDMNIELDEFIIMPNHFHAVIGIGRNEFNYVPDFIDARKCDRIINNSSLNYQDARQNDHTANNSFLNLMDARHCVLTAETEIRSFYKNTDTEIQKSFGPQSKNLSSVIRGFKSSVTQWCRVQKKLFDWQPRFHDILIRDEITLNKIRKYIQNNPSKWKTDRFNKL